MLMKASKMASCTFNFCSSKEMDSIRLFFVNSSKNLYQDAKMERFKVLGRRCLEFVDALEGRINSFVDMDDAKQCCCTMYVVTRTRSFLNQNSNNLLNTRNKGSRLSQARKYMCLKCLLLL